MKTHSILLLSLITTLYSCKGAEETAEVSHHSPQYVQQQKRLQLQQEKKTWNANNATMREITGYIEYAGNGTAKDTPKQFHHLNFTKAHFKQYGVCFLSAKHKVARVYGSKNEYVVVSIDHPHQPLTKRVVGSNQGKYFSALNTPMGIECPLRAKLKEIPGNTNDKTEAFLSKYGRTQYVVHSAWKVNDSRKMTISAYDLHLFPFGHKGFKHSGQAKNWLPNGSKKIPALGTNCELTNNHFVKWHSVVKDINGKDIKRYLIESYRVKKSFGAKPRLEGHHDHLKKVNPSGNKCPVGAIVNEVPKERVGYDQPSAPTSPF